MSSIGYDLDSSGGLMPLIRALIKPPDEDSNAQKAKKPQHPYYKRPGKGHNHDSCDACGEGGDLICCDRCPASFHLGCYDPPLDENDIPAGQWLCKECRGADAEKPPSSRSSRAQSPADSKSDTERKTRARSVRANSVQRKKGKEQPKEEEKVEEKKEEEKELSPMEVLVKAARIMNPKQFELPEDLQIQCPFPGTERESDKPSTVSVDASGCVPPPARSCFTCGATCRAAPLLQCDYCPLLYHQDCLDPPMTALPTGRWMCPNHVEQYIDWKMVNSISATERVALWDKFSGPVDHQQVKVDFIRRARNNRPLFRMKIPVACKGRVVVPSMVRYHYQNPPPLMPSRREYVRCRNVLRHLRAGGVYDESENEGEEKKHKICMNLKCPKYTEENGTCPHDDDDAKSTEMAREKMEDDTDDSRNSDEESDSSGSDMDLDELLCPIKRRKVSDDEDKSPKKKDWRSEKLTLCDGPGTRLVLRAARRQLRCLDRRLITLLAWQRLQQVACGERSWGAWSRAPLSALAQRAVLRGLDRARLTRLGLRRAPLPSELLSKQDQERIARRVWGAEEEIGVEGLEMEAGSWSDEEGLEAGAARRLPPAAALSDACVRAALLPVHRHSGHGANETGFGRALPMRLARLTLGGGRGAGAGGCDVAVPHSRCRYVTPHHATIFYDEVSRHFELMNYSEWGTVVNGVLYGSDARQPSPPPHTPPPALAAKSHPNPPVAPIPSITKSDGVGCACGTPRPPTAAWEGSALLPHGALIQIGCVQFVFVITDYKGFPYESPPRDDDSF